MKAPHLRPSERAGFTSVEALLGVMLLASLMLVAGLATERCMALFHERRAAQAVGAGAHRLLHRVASELSSARRGTLQPATLATQGSSSIQFQKCLGVVAGEVQWSSISTLQWEREASELDDGADDDGDGLVDEGQVVLIEDQGLPGERRTALGHGLCELLPGETFNGADEDGDGLVDERGLCFSIQDDVLTIRVGKQGRSAAGTTITRVVETSVYLRN
jgi:hypothetical protein